MNLQKLKGISRSSLSGISIKSSEKNSTPESIKTTKSKLFTPCRRLGLNRKKSPKILTQVLSKAASNIVSDSANDVLNVQTVSSEINDVNHILTSNIHSSHLFISSPSTIDKEHKTKEIKSHGIQDKPLELRVKLEKIVIEPKVPSQKVSKRKVDQLCDNKVIEKSKKLKKSRYLSKNVGSIEDDLILIGQIPPIEDIAAKLYNQADDIQASDNFNIKTTPEKMKTSSTRLFRLPISEKSLQDIEPISYNTNPSTENSTKITRQQLHSAKLQQLVDKTDKFDNIKVKTLTANSHKRFKHRSKLFELQKISENNILDKANKVNIKTSLVKQPQESQDSSYNIEEVKLDITNESSFTSLEKSPSIQSERLKAKEFLDEIAKSDDSKEYKQRPMSPKSQIYSDKNKTFESDVFSVKRSYHKPPKSTKPQSLKLQEISDVKGVKSDNYNMKTLINKSRKTVKLPIQLLKSEEMFEEIEKVKSDNCNTKLSKNKSRKTYKPKSSKSEKLFNDYDEIKSDDIKSLSDKTQKTYIETINPNKDNIKAYRKLLKVKQASDATKLQKYCNTNEIVKPDNYNEITLSDKLQINSKSRISQKYSTEMGKVQFDDYNVKISLDKLTKNCKEQYLLSKSRTCSDASEITNKADENVKASDKTYKQRYHSFELQELADKNELSQSKNCNSSEQKPFSIKSQGSSDINKSTKPVDSNIKVLADKLQEISEQETLEYQSTKLQKSSNSNKLIQPDDCNIKASSDKSEKQSEQENLSTKSQESSDINKSTLPNDYNTKTSAVNLEEISEQQLLLTNSQDLLDTNRSTQPDDYNIVASSDKTENISEQGSRSTKSQESLETNISTQSDNFNITVLHDKSEVSEQDSRSTKLQESIVTNKSTQPDDHNINSCDKSEDISEQVSLSTKSQESSDIDKLTEPDDYDIIVSPQIISKQRFQNFTETQELSDKNKSIHPECYNINVSYSKLEDFFEQRLQHPKTQHSSDKTESTNDNDSIIKVSLDKSDKNKESLNINEGTKPDGYNIKVSSEVSSQETPQSIKSRYSSNKKGSIKTNNYSIKVKSDKTENILNVSQGSSHAFSDKTETSKLSQVMSENESLVYNSDTSNFSQTTNRRKKKKSITGKHKKHSSKSSVSKQKLDTHETRSVVSTTYDSDSDDDFVAKPRRDKRSSMLIKQESNSQSSVKTEGGTADDKKKLKKMKNIPVLDELNKTEHLRIAENKSYSVVHKGNVISYVKSHDNDVDMKTTESDDNQQPPTSYEVPVIQKSMIIERKDYITSDSNTVSDIENKSGLITSMFDDVNSSGKYKHHVTTDLKHRKHKKIKTVTDLHVSKSKDDFDKNLKIKNVSEFHITKTNDGLDKNLKFKNIAELHVSKTKECLDKKLKTKNVVEFHVTKTKDRLDKNLKIKNVAELHASKTIDGPGKNLNTYQYKNPCQITIKNPRSLTVEGYEEFSSKDSLENIELVKLRKEITIMEHKLKIRRDKLESLKRVIIYKKTHDLDALRALTLQIKRGGQEALIDLLLVLKEHSNAQFDMGTLLHNMKIPNNLVGYNEDEDNFV